MTGPCNNNKLFLSQVVYLDEAFLSGISDSAVLFFFILFERLGPRLKYTVVKGTVLRGWDLVKNIQ